MTRAGFVAVIGAPNAGKSTLVNRLVGSKVSIVTRKVQTTRFPIRGVALEGETQMVLVDTPGIFEPRRRLDRAMVRAAWGGARDADAIAVLLDAPAHLAVSENKGAAADRRAVRDFVAIGEGLGHAKRQAVLVLNKIDGMRRDTLLGLADSLFDPAIHSDVFMISAASGAGADDLKQRLAGAMPEGPWFYPADQSADMPTRLLAAEVTREKVYLRVHEELPYAVAVETTAFEERADGGLRIEQTLFVEREGQRPILLGKAGQTLKWIGSASRTELCEILDRPVHLFLTVKVDAGWAEDRRRFSDLGLDFDV